MNLFRAAADLHIHSCLSPCGDDLMTPNNIVNMAVLKELDVIAVTDHNTAGNLPAVFALARENGLSVLPGIEANTAEEVHVLCYFYDLEACLAFSDAIYEHLPPIPNRPDFFGEQLVLDAEDETVRVEDRLLISALDVSIDELVALCGEFEGICVPAHINRMANSLLNNLGFLPPGVPFAALEVASSAPPPDPSVTEGWRILQSSDAHRLDAMLERESFIEGLDSLSARSVFRLLKEGLRHA